MKSKEEASEKLVVVPIPSLDWKNVAEFEELTLVPLLHSDDAAPIAPLDSALRPALVIVEEFAVDFAAAVHLVFVKRRNSHDAGLLYLLRFALCPILLLLLFLPLPLNYFGLH